MFVIGFLLGDRSRHHLDHTSLFLSQKGRCTFSQRVLETRNGYFLSAGEDMPKDSLAHEMSLSLRSILLKRLEGFYRWLDSSSLEADQQMNATCGSQRKKGQEGTALSWFLVTDVSCLWHTDFWGNSTINFPRACQRTTKRTLTSNGSLQYWNHCGWNFCGGGSNFESCPEVLSLTLALPGEEFQVHLSTWVKPMWQKNTGISYKLLLYVTYALVIHTSQWFHLHLRSM